jgi:hypothetical protein
MTHQTQLNFLDDNNDDCCDERVQKRSLVSFTRVSCLCGSCSYPVPTHILIRLADEAMKSSYGEGDQLDGYSIAGGVDRGGSNADDCFREKPRHDTVLMGKPFMSLAPGPVDTPKIRLAACPPGLCSHNYNQKHNSQLRRQSHAPESSSSQTDAASLNRPDHHQQQRWFCPTGGLCSNEAEMYKARGFIFCK